MNMMTAIEVPTVAATKTRSLKAFLDDDGNPSERCGPDLTQAESIDAVIKRLAPMRNGYAVAFLGACKASGIDVSIMRSKEGEDRLMIGFPLDCQEDLRRPRYNALCAQLKRRKHGRREVIELVNLLGRFADNQPYGSVEEAANAYTAAGGRIWVGADGKSDEIIPNNEDRFAAEFQNGFEMRRIVQRYEATLRKRGAREAMADLILKKGKLHNGGGWTVLEAGEQTNG